jgi:glycosyltransferase involved in cell wall biosynthesis
MRTVSVVSPCYNEQATLDSFFEAILDLRAWCSEKSYELEIVLVDDGSSDNSREMIASFCAQHAWTKAAFNSRNMGVYRTSYLGLRYCTGEWIVPMFPVDLQDPLDVLKELLDAKAQTGAAAVMGKKIDREESAVMAAMRKLFYVLITSLSSHQLERNAGEFGVLDRWIVDECLRRDDYYPFLRGMIANITGDVVNVEYVWRRRAAGASKHNLVLLYDHAVNGLVSTGRSFIRPIVVLGIIIGLSSFLFAMTNVVIWFVRPGSFALSGLPTLIVGLFFLMGMVLVVLGLLGEYIFAIHEQVRGSGRAIPAKLINIASDEGEK